MKDPKNYGTPNNPLILGEIIPPPIMENQLEKTMENEMETRGV